VPHFTCQAAAGVAIGFLYTECPVYGWEVDAAGIVMLAGACVESAVAAFWALTAAGAGDNGSGGKLNPAVTAGLLITGLVLAASLYQPPPRPCLPERSCSRMTRVPHTLSLD